MVDGVGVEKTAGGAGDIVPVGVKKRFRSSEKITSCVLALSANKPS